MRLAMANSFTTIVAAELVAAQSGLGVEARRCDAVASQDAAFLCMRSFETAAKQINSDQGRRD
jgi:ABC-type nitrate/sulfonate/bicarbonate transport system permease component